MFQSDSINNFSDYQNMQVKKVFSVDTIKINQKPARVKPKYKTYRELLDLDRPKKILQL
jgi:hypothetical protein